MNRHEYADDNNKKKIIIIFVILLILSIIGIAIFIVKNNKENNDNNDNKNNTDIVENTIENSDEKTNNIKLSLEEIVSNFGGTVVEKVSEEMCYITKDGIEYTVYLDGDILLGRVTPWNGSESKPAIDEAGNINIYTAEELKWVANQVISGSKNFAGVTIVIRKGIDLSGRYDVKTNTWSGNQWEAIVGKMDSNEAENASSTTEQVYDDSVNVKEEKLKRFAGTLDANNQTIKGLYINNDKDYQGLIGYLTGTVSNLTISNSYVKGNEAVGAIVGLNGGTVNNCKITNTKVNGNTKVGGLIGITMPQSNVQNVIAEGNSNIVNGTDFVGGIIGYVNNNSILGSCINESSVTGSKYVGGISGIAFYGTAISNSVNRNNTVSGEEYVGGISGYSEAQIEFSYNQDIITDNENASIITGNKYIGGIVGTNYDVGLINSCYNNGKIVVKEDIAGGIAGINNATIQNTYNKCKIDASNSSGKKIGGICGQNSSNCLISNSYNIGEILNPVCDGIIGDNFGNIDKCYYLDSSVKNNNSDGESKTEQELKSLSDTLGESFVNDTNNINNGYPILNWQLN